MGVGGGRFASDGNDLIRWDLGANSKEKKKRKRRRNVQVRKRSSLNGRSKNLLFCKVEIQKSPVLDFYANSSPAVSLSRKWSGMQFLSLPTSSCFCLFCLCIYATAHFSKSQIELCSKMETPCYFSQKRKLETVFVPCNNTI